jgi:hypothetical protein
VPYCGCIVFPLQAVSWSVCRSVGRWVGRSVGRSVGQSVGWLVSRSVGQLVDWLVGQLVSRLSVDWSTIRVPNLWEVSLQKDKNSYCPFLRKIAIQNKDVSKFHVCLIFFSNTKLETMGVVRHGLCRHPWQSAACSTVMILLATSWATKGALDLVKFKQGGEL